MKRLLGSLFSTFKAVLPARPILGVCMLASLAGCGGGGGGSNSGQAPDPVVVDLPIAYIQRPIPVDENENPVFPDVFRPDAFNPGGELYLKDRATAQAAVTNVSRVAFADNEFFDAENPNYDVKDVSVHPDGSRLLFSMRAPLDPDLDEDDERQPTWNIWEYHIKTKALRRVISADFEAEKGHDVAPRYLPDGRILFTSDRQKRSKEILLDEGKPQFGATTTQNNDITSFLLHTVKDDGTDIQQLTYNQSHDIQPSVLADGRLLFMRWQGNNPDRLSFYTANPDGTDIQRYFGYLSLNTEPGENLTEAPRLFHPQVMPDGRIAAIYMQNTLQLGGDMVVVDGRQAAEGGVDSISIKPVDISTDHVSLHGRFASLSPLHDGTDRLLVSWSQCRLQETATGRLQPCLDSLLVEGVPVEGYEEAPPFYGIWIYDINNQTQLPVVLAEDGKLFTEAVALAVRPNPPAYIEPDTDSDLALENVGLLHIRSLYDMDGVFNPMGSDAADLPTLAARPAEQRPARFIRLVKAVSVADDETLDEQDDNIYGNLFNNNTGIEEILGYAPVEPDGSVMVKVPADVAFSIEVLDKDGRQIGANHNVWLQVRPGETLQCNGCHNPANTEVIHGRQDLPQSPAALNTGAVTAASFPNTRRYDRLGAPLVPEMGQTMAEFAAQSTYCTNPADTSSCFPMKGPGADRNLREPTVDLVFRDEWSDPALVPSESFAYRYNDLLPPPATPDQVPAPTPVACRDENSWNSNCRVVINYEYHIQPLWEREREPMTVNDLDLGMDTTATTCAACHSTTGPDGNLQEPAAQLDLVRTKENANAQMRSYLQLLNARRIQRLYESGLVTQYPACEFEPVYDFIPECEVTLDSEGVPTCEGIDNCPFEILDEETGELALDNEGRPIPRLQDTGTLPAPMSRAGARASNRFFNKFENNGSHMGFLNPAELKLLSEWLDTDGRYYTNPFEMAIQN